MNDVSHELLGRGSAGGDADGAGILHPLGTKIGAVGDEMTRRSHFRTYLTQPI
jgi:hypothetical protein